MGRGWGLGGAVGQWEWVAGRLASRLGLGCVTALSRTGGLVDLAIAAAPVRLLAGLQRLGLGGVPGGSRLGSLRLAALVDLATATEPA